MTLKSLRRHIAALPGALMPHTVVFAVLLLQPPSACAAARVLPKDYTLTVKSASGIPAAGVVSMGDRCLKRGEKDKAMVYYMVACSRFDADMPDGEKRQCVMAHLKAGMVYYQAGLYANALDMYVKGLRACESCKGRPEAGRFYNNIGSVYCMFQDYGKGLDYYQKAYRRWNEDKDSVNGYKALVNIVGCCIMRGDISAAHRYHRISERMTDVSDDENNFMRLHHLGLIRMHAKDYGKAVAALRKGLGYARAHKMKQRYVCSSYLRLYRCFMEMGQRDSAITYMRLCEQASLRDGLRYYLVETLRDYADFYKACGDVRKANACLSEYVVQKDTMYNIRDFNAVKNTQFLYDMEKTGRYIAGLNAKEKERVSAIRFYRNAAAGVSAVALTVGFLLIIVYRQKRRLDRSYNDLFEVNRNFVERQNDMRRLREDLRPAADAASAPPPVRDASCPGTQKYRSSCLNDSQRRMLADAIAGVMECGAEFCDPGFSLDRLADLTGSNSKYVSQVINGTFHKNFSNYVNEYRIHLACLRIADSKTYGTYTMRAIAESVGFNSYPTFVSVFRKVTGLTPSVYQSKARRQG